MESESQKCVVVGGECDDQRQDGDQLKGIVQEIIGPEADVSEELVEQYDGSNKCMSVVVENESMNSVAKMELHIQQCHERIMEFNGELKQRDVVIIQLREMLSGLLGVLKDVQLQTANKEMAVFKLRVHSAAELLGDIGFVKNEDVIGQEQKRSLTEETECSIVHQDSEYISMNMKHGVIEAASGECQPHCVHMNEIIKVMERVHVGLEALEISDDILVDLTNVSLENKIEVLTSQALKYKQISRVMKEKQKSTLDEAESIKRNLLIKEEELGNLKAHMEALNMELKETKDRANKLEEELVTNRKCFLKSDEEKNVNSKTLLQDKCTQCDIDVKIIGALLDTLPCESSKLTDLKSKLFELKPMRSEGGICCTVLGNGKGSNTIDLEEVGSIECTKADSPKKFESDSFSNLDGNGSRLLSDSEHVVSQVSENVSVDGGVKSEVPNACNTISETIGLNEWDTIFCHNESSELGIGVCLLDNKNAEKLLLDLGAKARELSLAKKNLKVMKERENALRNQLSCALDNCEITEKQRKNAENLAINLQNDLEVLLWKTHDINTTPSETGISGLHEKITSSVKVYPTSQVKSEIQQISLTPDAVSSSTELKEEFISSFLSSFSKKMGSVYDIIVNISEEKTDILFPKKMACLKTSLESDVDKLTLYLKRKNDILMQMKASLEAESCFHELKLQFEKDIWNQSSFKNVFSRAIESKDCHGLEEAIGWIDDISPGDSLSSLNQLYIEMDSINSKVIKCLKYCMEQDIEMQTAKLKINHANEVTSLKQLHILQLDDLKKEMSEKMASHHEKFEEMLRNMPNACWEIDPSEILIKGTHKLELGALWNDEKQKEVFESLREIFGKNATEQISLAANIYKESYDLKMDHELSLLKSIYEQEIEATKSALEHQKLKELLHIRQEMSRSHKGNMNEIIQAVEIELKEVKSRCYDLALRTSMANTATLDELRKKIIAEFEMALKELGGMCLKNLENEAGEVEKSSVVKEKDAGKSILLSGSDGPKIKDSTLRSCSWVDLCASFLLKSQGHFEEIAQWQMACLKELLERLQVEQNKFKAKLSESQPNENRIIITSKNDGDKLLETRSECYSVNQNICTLMGAGDGAWINEMHTIKKELKAKYEKDMESLRLYFEKKCADVEKRYSEEVNTQRSKKYSHIGISGSSSNNSTQGSDVELELDQFFLPPEDVHTRNHEDCKKVSMDTELMVGICGDERKQDLVAKIREELRQQFEEEHQKRLADTIKELEAKHKEELKAQISAEAKAYSDHIEEVTNAIKKCSEGEQEKFMRSHREMMDNFLIQHQKDLIASNNLHDEKVCALQQRDVSGEVEELKAEIEKMCKRHHQDLLKDKMTMEVELNDVSQRLTQKHANELCQLKENLETNHKEEVEKLKNEIKRKDAYCEELKRHCVAELDELRGNFEARLQEKVEQARHALVKSLEEHIQALLAGDEAEGGSVACGDGSSIELSHLKAQLGVGVQQLVAMKKHQRKESEEVKNEPLEKPKKLMDCHSELSNPVMLEQQVDMLKRGIDSDFNDRFSRSECIGRDILTIKLQVKQMEQSKNLLLSRFGEANVEIDDATSVTLLNTDLDKLLKDRDKWKMASQTLRRLLKDVLEYTHICEDELNGTIVQSILRLSGVSDKCSLSEESAEVVKQPRRVHFAPERLPNILEDDNLGERGEDDLSHWEELGQEIRIELKNSLARLRAEASALLGLSATLAHSDEQMAFNNNTHSQQELIDKISCLENYLKVETMEKDKLKVELHRAKGLCEGHAAAQTALQARVTQAETQLTAMLMKKAQRGLETEGFGEASPIPNCSGQLQKIAQLREKAQLVLKEYHRQGGFHVGLSGALVAQLIEELCNEGDRLAEEAHKEREDLQLQVEAADKQLRSTRAFLEEQAVEREQEREEFQRELNRLHEAMGSRERDRERITKEGNPPLNEKEDQEAPSRATVERLEQQSNETSQMLEEIISKKEQLEVELKTAVDKIWELRQIIRELEGQFEGSLLLEKDLRSKNERLAAEFTLQGKKLNNLIEELESLRSSLGYSIPGEMENEGHTALLEKALRKHCLQVEQAKALGPSLKDLSKKLIKMGVQIDKKTKEIEALQVTLATCGNCSSPSEDVSIREQLEQTTWCSESPAEDNVSDQGVEGSEEDSDKHSSSCPIPHVPLLELNLLKEKFNRHFQAQEPLLKKIHDLEMQVHSLRHNEEELTTEREVLQSQVAQQLLHVSELQARLDEARRRGGRQLHCTTVTPLPSSPRSPIGSPSTTPDQQSFCCAGLADARHEIENLSECLEKKELEVTQLKGALENSKKVVAYQENELMVKAREEAQTLEQLKDLQRLKSEKDALQVQFSEESLEMGLISPNSRPDLSLSGDIEVMRDCVVPEQSIEKVDFLHHEEYQEHHKGWLHSTKIEATNSTGSPGLSPLMPYVKKVQDLVNDPVLEEESLGKLPSYHLSDDSSKSGGGNSQKEENHIVKKNEITPKIMKDVEVQTTEIEDLKASLKVKEEEIEVLTKKLYEVIAEKSSMSDLVSELREKIDWHSRHLENLEEESLGRDLMINEIRAEKETCQTALKKSEQEVEILKTSNSSLQDEIFKREEQIKLLSGKVDNFSQANKEQHMLLKATQQERKDVLSMIDAIRTEPRKTSEYGICSPSPISSEKQASNGTKDKGTSQLKVSSPVGSKVSLREMVLKLVDEVHYVRNEINNLTSQKEQLWQDLEKALKSQEDLKERLSKVKTGSGSKSSDSRCTLPDQDEQESSSSMSLEQMIEKVQQEGIEVLSLSEIAAGRRSTPRDDTPMFTATPLDSPKPTDEMMNACVQGLDLDSVKSVPNLFSEEEKVQLVMRIQMLENELSSKEREDTRKRDWLEFQEKEGHAGWTGIVETVGQNHRHQLDILERLGEQRIARAQFEAEVANLKQQLIQVEAEEHKAVYRLGMERSHVIRLESALQQEKSNFSQLQVSLDKERKRADETKLLNSKVNKALQNELNQYQIKLTQLIESLKEEHNLRRNLEEQLKQLQEDFRDGRGAGEEQGMRHRVMSNDERMKLKKIEEDCERKALEQELEDEKQKRMEYQQKVVELMEILETRLTQDPSESARWSNTTPYLSEGSFNAEETLQNLKGINHVLGCHVRQKYPNVASLESEKNYFEVKCCHLEQKLVALKDDLTRERLLWANEKASLLRDQQYLFESSDAIPQHVSSKTMHKLQDSLRKLYTHYWRSERNRKALVWQKRYFLSLLGNYRIFKVETITELSKVTNEQRNVVDKITRMSNHSKGKSSSSQPSKPKRKVYKSFRVAVLTVIAILKMKVLVLRSMTGIQFGYHSILEDALLPAYTHIHQSPHHRDMYQPLPYASGSTETVSSHYMQPLSPGGLCRNSAHDMKHQLFP